MHKKKLRKRVGRTPGYLLSCQLAILWDVNDMVKKVLRLQLQPCTTRLVISSNNVVELPSSFALIPRPFVVCCDIVKHRKHYSWEKLSLNLPQTTPSRKHRRSVLAKLCKVNFPIFTFSSSALLKNVILIFMTFLIRRNLGFIMSSQKPLEAVTPRDCHRKKGTASSARFTDMRNGKRMQR